MLASPTILCAYEFGAGLGHLNRILEVARRLPNHCQLVFALPEPALGRAVIAEAFGDRATVVQGVNWPAPTDPKAREVQTLTFADVLRLFAFDDLALLGSQVARWRTILKEAKPTVVLADFAPTLRLASLGAFPVVVVGNGYTIPPGGRLLPPMRPWDGHVSATSRANEGSLLASVNKASGSLKGPPIDYVADLFQGDQTFVCTLPEFDPYRSFREQPTVWPFNIPRIQVGPSHAERQGARIFVYLAKSHPALRPVLAAVSALKTRVHVYIQGANPQEIANHCGRDVVVHVRPADLAAVLPQANALIHHAGLGTAYAGLMAGVPQLVVPLNLEHQITARGVQAFGTAVLLPVKPPQTPDHIRHASSQMLSDKTRQLAAIASAVELERRRVADPVIPVVEAVTSHL